MNTATGTWSFSIDEICEAITMGVGLSPIGSDHANSIYYFNGTCCEVSIQLFFEEEYSTTVVVESYLPMSNNRPNYYIQDVPPIVAQRIHPQTVLNQIAAKLDSMKIVRQPDEVNYYDLQEYLDEINYYYRDDNE